MKEPWRTSYGWATDDEDGWGSRYYFTYYTNLGERSNGVIVIEVILYLVILLLSITANVTIIGIVLRKKKIQTVTNCFIVNLAIADLVFVMGIPAIIGARLSSEWHLGETICKLLPYSQFVCGSVLLWTLTGISIDRVRCLTTSPYKSGLTKSTAIIICAISWIFTLLLYIPVAVFFREQIIQQNSTSEINPSSFARSLSYVKAPSAEKTNFTICTLVFPAAKTNYALIFTLPTIIISCLIPMSILVLMYHKIFSALRKIRRRLEEKAGFSDTPEQRFRESIQTIASQLMASFASTRSTSEPNTPIRITKFFSSSCFHRLTKHKRAVRLLYFNVITVFLMWLPMPIIMLLIYLDGHRWDEDFFLTTNEFMWCVSLALVNTVVNPIFYGFLTENFRNNFPINEWLRTKRINVQVEQNPRVNM